MVLSGKEGGGCTAVSRNAARSSKAELRASEPQGASCRLSMQGYILIWSRDRVAGKALREALGAALGAVWATSTTPWTEATNVQSCTQPEQRERKPKKNPDRQAGQRAGPRQQEERPARQTPGRSGAGGSGRRGADQAKGGAKGDEGGGPNHKKTQTRQTTRKNKTQARHETAHTDDRPGRDRREGEQRGKTTEERKGTGRRRKAVAQRWRHVP